MLARASTQVEIAETPDLSCLRSDEINSIVISSDRSDVRRSCGRKATTISRSARSNKIRADPNAARACEASAKEFRRELEAAD
jgi:hypothetical protein